MEGNELQELAERLFGYGATHFVISNASFDENTGKWTLVVSKKVEVANADGE